MSSHPFSSPTPSFLRRLLLHRPALRSLPGHVAPSAASSLVRLLVIIGLIPTALGLCIPRVALAAVIDRSSIDDSGYLIVSHSYLEGQDIPEIPSAITIDGSSYLLFSQDEAVVDETYKPPTMTVTRTIVGDVPSDDIENLAQYFGQTLMITEGDFVGPVARMSYEVVPVYESLTRGVDRTIVLEDMPNNDVALIPAVQDFSITSDIGVEATTIATLSRAAVSYSISSIDAYGLPISYQAQVTYRGAENYLNLHHYQVAAIYEGTLISSVRRVITDVTYRAAPADSPIVESGMAVSAVVEEPEDTGTGPDPLLLAGAASLGAALPAIGGFTYRQRRRGRIVSRGPNGFSVLCSVHEYHTKSSWEVRLSRTATTRMSALLSKGSSLVHFGYQPSARVLRSDERVSVTGSDHVLYEGRVAEELPLTCVAVKDEVYHPGEHASEDHELLSPEHSSQLQRTSDTGNRHQGGN